MKSRNGMTFVEILIVSALFTVISLALYNVFSNGIKVWQRAQNVVQEEDIIIFFEKLTKDLNNSYNYAAIPFEGSGNKFSFPSIIPVNTGVALDENSSVIHEQMGHVQYGYDYNTKSVFRRQGNYSQALNENYFDPQTLIEDVDSIRFRYYYKTESEEIFSEQTLETIPNRIEVTINFTDAGYQRAMKKIIPIPLGS